MSGIFSWKAGTPAFIFKLSGDVNACERMIRQRRGYAPAYIRCDRHRLFYTSPHHSLLFLTHETFQRFVHKENDIVLIPVNDQDRGRIPVNVVYRTRFSCLFFAFLNSSADQFGFRRIRRIVVEACFV